MHGTILITQPDPCSCALCRVNKLYESYDNLARDTGPADSKGPPETPGHRTGLEPRAASREALLADEGSKQMTDEQKAKQVGVRFVFAFLVPAAAAHAEQICQYRLEEYALRGDWFLVSRDFLFQTMQGIIVDQLRVTNPRVWLVGQ